MKIINFKKKKKEVIKKEQQESYENAKFCFICKEKFENKYFKKKKKILKLEIIVIILEKIEVLHIANFFKNIDEI